MSRAVPTTPIWTTPAGAVERLRKRWDRGEFLSAWARDVPFSPVTIPLHGPSSRELVERFDDVRDWMRQWAKPHIDGVSVRARSAGHHTIGANALPSHIEVHGYEALWQLLGVQADAQRFADLRAATEPKLVAWMNAHPMTVLAHSDDWPRLSLTASWIASLAQTHNVFLREVPIPGVDTKFIERHKGILAELLDMMLPTGRIDAAFPPSQFERRYGFALKPTFVRLRTLDPSRPLLPGITEMSVRSSEFACVAPDAGTVYIIENEITYLAFPDMADAAAVFGGGFAVSGIASAPWLKDRRIVYWGDIDTHGFVALDRLRAAVPHTESMLMDQATLLAHTDQWVREAVPTSALLPHLTESEAALYRELVEGVHGEQVRLEQERISFPMVQSALSCPARAHATERSDR